MADDAPEEASSPGQVLNDLHAAIGAEKNSAAETGNAAGFMDKAVKSVHDIGSAGLLGKAPMRAGDDAWARFHGGGGGDV